jgi:hypothetical protein
MARDTFTQIFSATVMVFAFMGVLLLEPAKAGCRFRQILYQGDSPFVEVQAMCQRRIADCRAGCAMRISNEHELGKERDDEIPDTLGL